MAIPSAWFREFLIFINLIKYAILFALVVWGFFALMQYAERNRGSTREPKKTGCCDQKHGQKPVGTDGSQQ